MSEAPTSPESAKDWRARLHEIIFEADTAAGKAFDVALLWGIVLSVIVVLLESVADIEKDYGAYLRAAEWFFTVLFTVEYVLRLLIIRKPHKYALSFFGVIDLLAIIPTYVSLFVAGPQYLVVLRAVRLLRVFRVLKLARYLGEARILAAALKASQARITVFLGAVITLVLIIGSVMYLIEGEKSGFTSIPRSMYWAIVTLTTVGYGDITPQTVVGQFLAAIVMIMGYGIIAVPTGIVSVELAKTAEMPVSTQACLDCGAEGHDADAVHCKYCGAKL